MTSNKHALWVEKYRPSNIDEYVFQNQSHKKSFLNMITDQTIPHLLLSGIQGSGKTTIAEILIKALDVDPSDLLLINASDDNSVDIMRDRIKSFISTFALGEFKVIQLEEADFLTQNAQAILRKYMEDPNCPARFILTCNYENKIMPAIKSRSQHFRFKAADPDEIAEYAAKILITEKVKFSIDLLDQYVSVAYPDVRKIVNMLQQNSIDGILGQAKAETEAGDYKFQILDLIGADDWHGVRRLALANVATEEWESLYKFLYQNLDKSKKFKNDDKWDSGIIIIRDHLGKNNNYADPEINFASCAIQLARI